MATPRTNASHDQNFTPTLLGVSTADGITPVPVEVDPVTGALQVAGIAGGGGTAAGASTAGTNSSSFTFTAVDSVAPVPDGTGTPISGTPTAGSIIALAVPDGMSSSLFLIKGLGAAQTTAIVYFETSANSTNGSDGDWTEVKHRRTGTVVGVEITDYKTINNGYFRGNPSDFKWIRARLIGVFAGGISGQIWVGAAQGAMFMNSGIPSGTSNIGTVGINDGTNTANVLKSDGTAAGQNSQLMAGAYLMPTAYSLTAGTQNTPWLDMGNYAWVAVECSITAGQITFQTSNDVTQTNTASAFLFAANGAGSTTTSSSATIIFHGPRTGRYFRVSTNLAGGATAAVVITLFSTPSTFNTLTTTQNNLASVGGGLSGQLAQIGVYDGGNVRTWAGDSSGNAKVIAQASTVGGYTPGKLISAATTNATNIKASAGTLGFITAFNNNAAQRYVKIYDKATSPTVGTDIPVHTYPIPGGTAGAGTNIPMPTQGIACTNGISLAITTGVADSDTGAVAANEIIINYGTK